MDVTPFKICMVNRKGGCAKTGSTHQLSGCFAKMGLKVLLVDMDPQASLTQGFFGPAATENLPPQKTILALFDDSLDPDPEKVLIPTPCEGITILAGANGLDDYNRPRPEEEGPLQTALRGFLKEVEGQFDVVLIDCPPNLQLCSWAALLASDFVVVPVIPEDFSSQGLIYVQQAIDAAMTNRNPRLRLLGYMLTMYNRQLGIHKAYEKLLREQYSDLVLENVFPLATAFKEAVSRRHPIGIDKPKSTASEAVATIAGELSYRAPIYGSRPAEYYYAGNRYVPGVAEPQEPEVYANSRSEEAA